MPPGGEAVLTTKASKSSGTARAEGALHGSVSLQRLRVICLKVAGGGVILLLQIKA